MKELVEKNIPITKKCIKDMLTRNMLYINSEEEFESVYFYALEGLINGVKTYDKSQAKKSTYYYKCARNGILKYIHFASMQKRKLDKTIKYSLDDIISDSPHSHKVEDIIEDERVNIEKQIETKYLLKEIKEILDNMKFKKTADVIKMRFGICGYDKMKIKDIAKELNVSKNMITARLQAGLDEIRIKINGGNDEDYKKFKKNKKKNKK